MPARTLPIAVIVLGWGWLASAAAAPGPNAYALVIGSNRGGPGQTDLRFAQNDARQVVEVLTQVGRYRAANTRLILDPAREDLLTALRAVRARLEEHKLRGEPSQFLFYYSGHARARSLNLGRQELGLEDLRGLLAGLPSTLTIAILDACQTGAISRVKGADPAADFSYNSVNELSSTGLAVMASSTGSELSQEADALRGSYFTHYLLLGLRGAADVDTDGKITLSEAYRYAYNRTLVATAATSVGKQHVTLETKLRGQGEMVLTYPAAAASSLHLPARLSARLLLHRRPGETVMAELTKSPGKSVRLALPDGRYSAIVNTAGRTLRCELELRPGKELTLRTEGCSPEETAVTASKGPAARWHERWSLEVGVGLIRSREDGYTDRLKSFGFDRQLGLPDLFTYQVGLGYGLNRYLSVVASWSRLDQGAYQREVRDQGGTQRHQSFEWSGHAVGLYARGTLPLLRGILNPFVQGGPGLTWAGTVYRDPLQASEIVDDELHFGFHLAIAGGMTFMPWRHLGLYGQLSYLYAPTVKNLVGDVHDCGGLTASLGVRGAL